MRRCSLFWQVSVLLCSALAAGCSSGPKTYTVKGKVTLNGQPLPDADVIFLPLTEGSRQATGRTAEDGSFTLSTFGDGDGAMAGEYKITVNYVELVAETLVEQGEKPNIRDMMNKFSKLKKEAKKKPPKYQVAKQFSSAKDTPLRATVPTSGPVNLDVQGK